MVKLIGYCFSLLAMASGFLPSPAFADPNWRENMTPTYAPCPDRVEDAVWVPGWILTEGLLGELRIYPDHINFVGTGDYPITAHKTADGDTYYKFGKIFDSREALREDSGIDSGQNATNICGWK